MIGHNKNFSAYSLFGVRVLTLFNKGFSALLFLKNYFCVNFVTAYGTTPMPNPQIASSIWLKSGAGKPAIEKIYIIAYQANSYYDGGKPGKQGNKTA